MKFSNNEIFGIVERSILAGEDVTLRVVGNSMLPFIRGGTDAVRFTAVDRDNLHKGDIILFRHNGSHIMHRLVWLSGNILMARGDGMRGAPECFGREDVIARVSQIIRPDRTINTRSPWFRVRSWLWMVLRPIRRYLLRLVVLSKS